MIMTEKTVVLDNSGPAFPNEYTLPENQGITIRDYFIAHAPAKPQDWFQPEFSEPYPEPPETWTSPKRWWQFWRNMDDESADDRLWWGMTSAVLAWNRARDQQRLLQWPAAWADAMLAARKGGVQ
jgi:hypothetical protein